MTLTKLIFTYSYVNLNTEHFIRQQLNILRNTRFESFRNKTSTVYELKRLQGFDQNLDVSINLKL